MNIMLTFIWISQIITECFNCSSLCMCLYFGEFMCFKCVSVSVYVTVSHCVYTEMIHDWELYSVQQDLDPEMVRRSTEVANGMLVWMRKLDLSPRGPITTDEIAEAHECEEIQLTKLI